MKVLLEIKDNKALHLMEVLKSLDYISIKKVEKEHSSALDNIKAGLEEVRLFKEGRLKTTPAEEFLDEL